MDDGNPQAANAIFQASAQVNTAGFVKVLGGTGDFSNPETFVENLRDNFIVKDEVIITGIQVYGLQYFPGIGAVAGMVLGKLLP